LGKRRRSDVIKYFREIVSFDYQPADPIREDAQQKYVFHSILVNLDDVRTIYDFFKEFQDEFTTSSAAISNLCKK
jgi:hypothetical protein